MKRAGTVRRRYRVVLMAAAVLFVGMQFTPGPKPNPPVDPALALAAGGPSVPQPVLDTLQRACFDCHSNETTWPWYSRIAPASWLVAYDVEEGRSQMNFSGWTSYNPFDRADLLDEICDLAARREMPLWQYRLLHKDAALSDADIQAVCAWTEAEAERLTMGGQ
jgi:hypothetical protein